MIHKPESNELKKLNNKRRIWTWKNRLQKLKEQINKSKENKLKNLTIAAVMKDKMIKNKKLKLLKIWLKNHLKVTKTLKVSIKMLKSKYLKNQSKSISKETKRSSKNYKSICKSKTRMNVKLSWKCSGLNKWSIWNKLRVNKKK